MRDPIKGLINIKNDDIKCSMWCHVRYLNQNGVNLCRIAKKDREVLKKLNYQGVDFPVSKKDYGKNEVLIVSILICFVMKAKWFILFICLISLLMIV